MTETNPIIDKLFAAGAHFGYAPSRRHPSTSGYLFGVKGGVELFDLEQTAGLLDEARAFVKQLAAERKTILFIGGKAEAREAVMRAALRIAQPYCAGRWIGGSLTNWSEIKKRLGRLEELSTMREKGELAKFTKLERQKIQYPIPANDASRETLTIVLDEITKAYADNLPPAADRKSTRLNSSHMSI